MSAWENVQPGSPETSRNVEGERLQSGPRRPLERFAGNFGQPRPEEIERKPETNETQ